jgi:hypothetical protein
MGIAGGEGMNAPKQESTRQKSTQQVRAFAAFVVIVVVVGVCIEVLVPNSHSIDSITASDNDDHPILTVPTVGRITRFHRDDSRTVTEWGGRVDLARFAEWRETVPKQADPTAGFGIDGPVQTQQNWPHEILELAMELHTVPFIRSGEMVWEWSIVRGTTSYRLRVSMTSGNFLLIRAAIDDEG